MLPSRVLILVLLLLMRRLLGLLMLLPLRLLIFPAARLFLLHVRLALLDRTL